MAKQNMLEMVGGYLFLLGVVIALISGFIAASWILPLLVVLGLIVGIFNVTDKEIDGYLLAVIAIILLASTSAPIIKTFYAPLETIFLNVALFAAFGAIIPALKKIYNIAKA